MIPVPSRSDVRFAGAGLSRSSASG